MWKSQTRIYICSCQAKPPWCQGFIKTCTKEQPWMPFDVFIIPTFINSLKKKKPNFGNGSQWPCMKKWKRGTTKFNRQMEYTNNVHFHNSKDVEDFVNYLVYDCNIFYHPDDDFTDYFCNKKQAELYNRLNEESFAICEKDSLDLYQIHFQAQYNYILKNSD